MNIRIYTMYILHVLILGLLKWQETYACTEHAHAVQSSLAAWINHPPVVVMLSPTYVYTIDLIALQWSPTACSGTGLHYLTCASVKLQVISVGFLYTCFSSKTVCMSHDYIQYLVGLYCTSLCTWYIVRQTGLGHAGIATDLEEGISSKQDKFNE